MTNLVIPHVISVSNVVLTNNVVVTNADGSVSVMTRTGMTTVAIGPGAVVLVALVVVGLFLLRTFGKGSSEQERGQARE